MTKQELLDFMKTRPKTQPKTTAAQRPRKSRAKPKTDRIPRKRNTCKLCGCLIGNSCTDMMCDRCSENTIRMSCGLAPNVKKTRQCLKCGVEFTSEGRHHRSCAHCNDKNRRIASGTLDALMPPGWRQGNTGATKPRRKAE